MQNGMWLKMHPTTTWWTFNSAQSWKLPLVNSGMERSTLLRHATSREPIPISRKRRKRQATRLKGFFHTQKQFWILMYISALIIVLVHRTCIYYIIYMHWLNSSFGVYSCITLVVHMSHMGTSTRPPGQLSVSQCRSAVTGSKIQVHIKIIFKTKTPRDPFRLLTFIKILY